MGYKDIFINYNQPADKALAEAKRKYNFDNLKASVCETNRRFKPLVVVGHDINGEYGHGGHIIFCAALREVLEHTADETYLPDSAEKYGVWDVPKTYLHLYGENKLRLNMREPLSEFGGKTYKTEGHIFNPEKSYGYGGCEDIADLNKAVAALYMDEIVPCVKKGLCAAIYTQVSDVEDEINGLMTYDRRVEKLTEAAMLPVAEALTKAMGE
jgi:hypothetical protein